MYTESELKDLCYKYKQHLKSKEYVKANLLLSKYIELAEKIGVLDMYYKLEDLITLQAASKLPPDTLSKGNVLTKKYKSAIKENNLNEALNISYEYCELFEGTTVNSYLYPAKVYTLLGKYNIAEERINEALEINPSSPFAYVELIKLKIATNQFDEALEKIEKFTKLDKFAHPSSYLYSYEVYYLTGEIDKANSILKEACDKLNPVQKDKFIEKVEEFIKSSNITKNDVFKSFKPYIKTIKSYLEPDDDNVVRPRLIDGYIKNLDLSDNDKALLKLKTAKLLEENRFSDRAAKMIKEVEQTKDKSDEVKKQLRLTRSEIRLIKNR